MNGGLWHRPTQTELLISKLSLRLPSGMMIHDLTYHQREDGARWVGLPARQYTKQDCTIAYQRIIDFAGKEAHARFQKLAKDAIDRYFAAHKERGAAPAVAGAGRAAAR